MMDEKIKLKMEKVRNKILVLSGKGGVGKSTVAVNLAYGLSLQNYKTGLLDIDIHGPDVSKMLGIERERLKAIDNEIEPVSVNENLKVVSMSFLLESADTPVIWRGPLKMKAISQFLGDTRWGELDFLVIDAPPGTGDEPLSVCQLIPDITGSVIVTTPQEVALLDVRKTIKFSQQLGVKILGVIENMSYLICPACGFKILLFGEGGGEKLKREFKIELLGRIPFIPEISKNADSGKTAFFSEETEKFFREIVDKIVKILNISDT